MSNAPPRWIKPQLAALVKQAPESGDWLHEIKLDGYRMHARLEAGDVRLPTRRGHDWTDKYPSIARAVAGLPAQNAYLDGERCGLLPDGRTSFNLIQNATDRGAGPLAFFLFDLLFLNGKSLIGLPLIDRKARLAQIIYNSFAGLGIEAGGGTISAAQLLQPGKIAEVGIDAGKPILTAISGMMGFTSVFANLVQIIILLVAWLIVIISFFVMAIQLFVSLIEFKLTTLAGFVLVPFGLFGRTAFLAERVLGNVVSSGIKILVLAVIIGIGSTIFSQFTSGFNNPPTISDALTLILAALSLLGLTIFDPGIANGLIAGGPQLGAGAAVGTGLAAAGIGAAGIAATAGGLAAAGGAIAGTARAGGVAQAAGSVAMSPLRRAAASLKESFASGERAVMRGSAPASAGGAGSSTPSDRPPAWAQRMKRSQTISRGVSAADHAIRSGDRASGGHQIDLSEGD